jgi:hypothetical protein
MLRFRQPMSSTTPQTPQASSIHQRYSFHNIKACRMTYPKRVPDYNIKRLQRFERPYFSPHRDSYEIDYFIAVGKGADFLRYGDLVNDPLPPNIGINDIVKKKYLFCININTRYLFVYPLKVNRESKLDITQELLDEINVALIEKFGVDRMMKHIRGDADKTFGTVIKDPRIGRGIKLGDLWFTQNTVSEYLQALGTDLYLAGSKFINKSRLIDRVIRTFRDKAGDQGVFLNNNIMQTIVNKYNHTRHTAFDKEFTPLDVQSDPEIEDYFIRKNLGKLEEIREAQYEAGLLKYQPGNVIRLYFRRGKTEAKFSKRRYNFDTLAEFIRYEHGNVMCRPFKINRAEIESIEIIEQGVITLPIYYTKYLSKDIHSIPYEYRQAFSD